MGVHERRIASTKNPITVPNNSDESLTIAGIEACPIKFAVVYPQEEHPKAQGGGREVSNLKGIHMGLVLGRKNGDTIVMKPPKCERITVKVIEVKGSIVKLWIDAPPSVVVNRGEIQEAKDAELRGDPNGEDYA